MDKEVVAIDETVVKANKMCYYIERSELIFTRVYTTRNWLTAESFIKEVLLREQA